LFLTDSIFKNVSEYLFVKKTSGFKAFPTEFSS